jgi:hypothetical protein
MILTNMVRVFFVSMYQWFDLLLLNIGLDAIYAQLTPIYATNVFDDQPSDC